jgi:hypothetical protein
MSGKECWNECDTFHVPYFETFPLYAQLGDYHVLCPGFSWNKLYWNCLFITIHVNQVRKLSCWNWKCHDYLFIITVPRNITSIVFPRGTRTVKLFDCQFCSGHNTLVQDKNTKFLTRSCNSQWLAPCLIDAHIKRKLTGNWRHLNSTQ